VLRAAEAGFKIVDVAKAARGPMAAHMPSFLKIVLAILLGLLGAVIAWLW